MSSLRARPLAAAGRAGVALVAAVLALWPLRLDGQMMARRATTVAAILRYPVFFHDKAISLTGTPVEVSGGELAGLPITAPFHLIVLPREGRVPIRTIEMRGRLLDVGRFASDDSRLGPLDIPRVVQATFPDRWPQRGQLFVLTSATWSDVNERPAPSLRNLAMRPELFDGRTITVRGRFRGRNLLGDLPAWPRQSEWDFVLQSSDGAVWITGKRPRGDGFDLSTTSRAQTGRWLEVTGQVKVVEDLPIVAAQRIVAAEPEDEIDMADTPPKPTLPPPELVFSAPAQDEIAIARDVVVRLQFSRSLDPDTVEPNIHIRYAPGVTEALPEWSATYRPGPIAVEIRFAGPLAPLAGVIVELGAGIQAPDKVALAPITLRFTTSGGSR